MTANSREPSLTPVFSHHIFARQRVGGISRYFIELNDALRRSGLATRILAPLHFTDGLRDIHGVVGMRVPSIPGTRNGVRLLCEAVEPVALRYWRRRLGAEVVVHRTYYSRSSLHSGVAHVETIHDMIHERFPEHFARGDRTRDTKRLACEKADMVIAVSEHTKQMLIEHFDLPTDRIRVCHHGVSAFPTDEGRIAELEGDVPFVLFVGNRGGYKNFSRLVEAFAASDAAKNGIKLRAFGGGAPSAAELEQIASLRLGELVDFTTGTDAELSAHYATALALVYPGLEEGFGMPPLEAMTHGCPVVASDSGGIPEVVGDAALLFDPSVVEPMTSAIDAVISDEHLRRKLASLGTRRAAMFTWEKSASTTTAAYKAALENAWQRA